MNNYKFICEQQDLHGNFETTITYELHMDTDLGGLLEGFKYFLAGCGFGLPDGELDFVDESEDSE